MATPSGRKHKHISFSLKLWLGRILHGFWGMSAIILHWVMKPHLSLEMEEYWSVVESPEFWGIFFFWRMCKQWLPGSPFCPQTIREPGHEAKRTYVPQVSTTVRAHSRALPCATLVSEIQLRTPKSQGLRVFIWSKLAAVTVWETARIPRLGHTAIIIWFSSQPLCMEHRMGTTAASAAAAVDQISLDP